MFKRNIEDLLLKWKNEKGRKPLVLRGARQTGKTTVVEKFSKEFKVFIELNLEKESVRRIFDGTPDIQSVIQSIESLTDQRIIPGETLLFLDEIQNSGSAIKMLRYFYEELSALHVISAGSLLEVRMKSEGWSFPVGRVEFLYLYPVTFEEFLSALNKQILLENLKAIKLSNKLPQPIHEQLLDLLALYMIVGGMPGAVNNYILNGSLISVKKYQNDLISSFREDFVKYSKASEVDSLKIVWDGTPFNIGKRIKYSKFTGQENRSKNISTAFDVLHDAMLVERIFPSITLNPPLARKSKFAPKSLFLDIGLCANVLNLTKDQIKKGLLDDVFNGGLFEQFAGQELLALNSFNRISLYFWIREEKGSSSELDFLLQAGDKLLPIEVKSGRQGSLKSLHQFLHRSNSNFGIRMYNGQLSVDQNEILLPSSDLLKYELLSIPFYLIFRLFDFTKR